MLLLFFGHTSWHAGSCSLIRDQTLCSLQWKHITQPLEHQGFPVHALLNETVIHFLSHSSFLVPSGPLWLVATILFRGVCVWLLYCFGVFFSVCVTTMLFRGVCVTTMLFQGVVCVCVTMLFFVYYIRHTFGFWTRFQPTNAGDTYNSTQFWLYWLGDSAVFQALGAQS